MATTNLPPDVRQDLAVLKADLDQRVPFKQLGQNLLIATWNIRAFGDLTANWRSGSNDSPKRDWHAASCIAEILTRFDIIAVQEIRANLRALRHTLKLMGDHYSFILTDVNQGKVGNNERMAFIFDNRRVQLSGLACELVVPDEWRVNGNGMMAEQFVRSPYAVSFKSKDQTFILVTLHILYGNKSADRVNELRGIARWMANWAKDIHSFHQNLIVLGDFNIDYRDDALSQTFKSEGLYAPPALADPAVLRSIFDEEKFYDQITWFNGENNSPRLSMEFLTGGYYNFLGKLLTNRGLSHQQKKDKTDISWMISDHYPLWAEFKI